RRAERAPSSEAARLRDIHERAPARVPEQPALADACDEDVGEAVVVEVAGRDAHAVQLDVEARRLRDVGERAVPVVLEQLQRGSLRCVPRPVDAVHAQNVLPAVVVVVEERAAGAERFGQQLASVGAAVVDEAQSGRRGDVREAERRFRRASARLKRRGRGRQRRLREEIAAGHSGLTRPFCRAYMTSSAVLCTPNVFMMLARCTATGLALTLSCTAISLFDRPLQMSCRTSISRRVSRFFSPPAGATSTAGSTTVSPAATRFTAAARSRSVAFFST